MSIQLFVADKLIRLTMKRRFARDPDVLTLRPIMARAQTPRVSKSVEVDEISLGGVQTERLRPNGRESKHAILYIHGGGFVAGHPANHRTLTSLLAGKLNATVYAVDYRLAPEHAFPAALEDCASAYRALIASGIAPKNLAVGGDSAGGNLTLALGLKLKSETVPLPAALVALSPATDLAAAPPSHVSNARSDAMFDARMFPSVVKHYCPGEDPANPLISPIRGDLRGLPPTLIQCSRDEMLRDDGVLMAERLKAAGVDVSLEVWPRVFHVWQVAGNLIPESRRAIANIVRFVASKWDDS